MMGENHTWTLYFEGSPASPNDRLGHFARAGQNRSWRLRARQKAIEAGVPQLNRAKISSTFYRRNLGVADEDNDRSRLKPIVDGLRDANVLVSDSRGYVIYGSCNERRKEKSALEGFEIKIEEVPESCSRCQTEREDVQELMPGYSYCLDCYAKFVRAFMEQRGHDTVRGFLEEITK